MEKMVNKFKKPVIGVMTALLLFSSPAVGFAEEVKTGDKNKKQVEKEVKPELDLFSESAFLYDMNLNKVIYEKNPDQKIPTASLAKVMTLLIASEQLASGNVKKEDKVTVSEKAWKTGGSRMFLEVGRQVPFNEIFKGVAVVSGNDASVAIAEHIDGSTEKFANRMNKKAKELGMKNTTFVSPNGLPVDDRTDISTAKDLGLMTKEYIKKYPGNLKIHSLQEYAFDTGRGVIEQKNRNPLLGEYKGADGLKTGFIEDTYNLIGTAQKDGIRLIFVSMKSASANERAKDAKTLLDYGFGQYNKYHIANKGEKISSLPVYKTKDVKKTDIVIKEDAEVVIHSSQLKNGKIEKKIHLPEYVNASKGLKSGAKVGSISYYAGKKEIYEVELVIREDLEPASWWEKGLDSIILFARWIINLF